MGFAVPNWGSQAGTKNIPIYGLVNEFGIHQLTVMSHEDVMRVEYPGPNTVKRLGRIFNRVKTVLSGRQRSSVDERIEPIPQVTEYVPFIIHPVPYFNSSFVVNPWLREYNFYAMLAITCMIQHPDNNLSLTITTEFASSVWQLIKEIGRLVASELCGMDPKVVNDPAFVFTDDSMMAGYASIAQRTINLERLATSGPIESIPTPCNLQPLFKGFATTELVSLVARYPVDISTGIGLAGAAVPASVQAGGVASGTQVAAGSPDIGSPQV